VLSGCTSATCQYNSALHRASLLGLLLIVLCWMKRAEEQRKQRCTAVQEYPEQHLHHEQHLQPHGLHCQTKRRKKSTTFSRCLLRSVTEPHKSQRGCCFKVMSTNWLPFQSLHLLAVCSEHSTAPLRLLHLGYERCCPTPQART